MHKIIQYLNLKNLYLEKLILLIVITLALFLRIYLIDERPGYEWDEPVYANIQANYLTYDYPTVKPEGLGEYIPYLYHPPFDFKIRSEWIKITGLEGVMGARILSVIASTLTLLLIYLLFRELTTKKASLISVLLLATDGWLIYTNRLNLIENIMIPIGIIAMALYAYAIKKYKLRYFILAGIMLGATAIYKHTGVYFLAIPLLYIVLTKEKNWENHIKLYLSSIATVGLYLIFMYLTWGDIYIEQTKVQVLRTLGILDSRGLNYSVLDAFDALRKTYWIYITTVVSLFGGTLLVIKDLLKFFITRSVPNHPLLLSWSLASLIFLLGISLRAPQYLVIALLPLYIYISVETLPWIIKRFSHKHLYLLLGIILSINSFTWYYRFIENKDNALLDTFNYMNLTLPSESVVLTEESIGVGIKQVYYKLDLHKSSEELRKIKPTFIVTYESSTQKVPRSDDLDLLIAESREIKQIKGFKENIKVFKTPQYYINYEKQIKVKVLDGESLWSIAGKYLGDPYRWIEIYNLNNLSNPDLIQVDSELELPKK